jgi:hypothetical protein
MASTALTGHRRNVPTIASVVPAPNTAPREGINAHTDSSVEMARRAMEVSICGCDSPDENSESARSLITIATTEQMSPIPTGPTNNSSNGPIRPIEKIPSPAIVFPL